MDGVEIREAARDDIPALQDLLREEEEHHRALYSDYFVEETTTTPAEELAGEIGSTDSTYLVAVEDAEVIGLVSLKKKVFSKEPQFKTVDFVIIEDCIVREDRRLRGIATRLMAGARQWAHERGIHRMQLQVWARNTEAARLYESLGYAPLVVRMELVE
jgi:GNAT superfamily N-acetyltransferase